MSAYLQAVIVAARPFARVQPHANLRDVGKQMHVLQQCFALHDGVLTEAEVSDDTRAHLRAVALGEMGMPASVTIPAPARKAPPSLPLPPVQTSLFRGR